MAVAITDDERAIYQRDGVVCIRGLVPLDWIERMRDAVDEVMATPTEFSRDLAIEAGKAGSFFQELNVATRHAAIDRFINDSPVAEAGARIMGSSSARFFSDQLLVKEPGTTAETLWHQDMPYFPVSGDQVGSIWVGLDPVTKATGAMSFVKGSHRSGKLYAPQNFGTGEVRDYAGEFDGRCPDIDADPEQFPTICYEMDVGDVTFHHARTLHGAKGNTSTTVRRRGYTLRLAGEDTAWRQLKMTPRGFVAQPDGTPLQAPRYPVLWQEEMATA